MTSGPWREQRGGSATAQKRGRKLYFVDGAIRNAALQLGLAPLDNPTELGVLVESLVAATVRSLALHTGVRLYHWRAFEIGSSPTTHAPGSRRCTRSTHGSAGGATSPRHRQASPSPTQPRDPRCR